MTESARSCVKNQKLWSGVLAQADGKGFGYKIYTSNIEFSE